MGFFTSTKIPCPNHQQQETKNSTNIAGAQKWHISEQVALVGIAEMQPALRWKLQSGGSEENQVFHHVQEGVALDPLSTSFHIRLPVSSGQNPHSHALRLLGQNLSNTVLLCLPMHKMIPGSRDPSESLRDSSSLESSTAVKSHRGLVDVHDGQQVLGLFSPSAVPCQS